MSTFLIDVPVPSMGATVNELTLIDLLVAPGAKITKGQKLAELESDKSAFDFEAPCDGTLVQLFCRAGDIVPVNAPFLRIETADISLKHLEVKGEVALAAAPTAQKSAMPAAAAAGPVPARPVATPLSAPARGPQWTPRAAKIAREAGLDPESLVDVPATGPGGRVSGDDIERYLAARATAPRVAQVAPAPVSAQAAGDLARETVCVAGIGYAVPRNVRSNEEILKAFPDKTTEEIVKITGIRTRYYASEDESATSLAVTAVKHALAQSGVNLAEIDGVIMATLIPDQPVPSAASALARELGIHHALCFDLNAACSGWLYALEIGRAFIRAGTAHKLIVVTAELLSRITNPLDFGTAFLFGDGAGAAILTDAPGGHRLNRMSLSGNADQYAAIQRTGGGARLPLPQPGCDLSHFYLQMDGPTVFKHAVIAFANIIESTLQRHGLRADDIAWIVPHQANERILKAVSKRVGIPFEKFVVTIGKYGNTSAASVSMALGWASEEGIFNPGDRIVFCSVGAGLTFAGGLLTW
ncbi:MAG: beta-ketoacyl-ACP synthase 3 [Opitutaceae bacterium]|nr:beta-ketoacyl-ACP synthase 3 [Opitutaceae bacterium]